MRYLAVTLLTAAFAVACGPVAEEVEETETELTCRDYCEKAAECDDETDVEECEADCVANVEDCENEDTDEVLADIDECAEESCDDFGSCTVGAAFECAFDL